MTKEQFCKMIIEREKGVDHNRSDESLIPMIYSSTSLGIALETLGVITPEKYPTEYNYLQTRGGVLYAYFDRKDEEVYQISMIELLSLLPDKIIKAEAETTEDFKKIIQNLN